MAATVAGSHVEFIRARSDKREYRRVVLPNALECLLISDAVTDKAAACMEVGVGSFSDPDGLEGLAHFLEHMLFYASEKYPGEHDYSKYITEYGGYCNAYTCSETTNFLFDVNVDNFEEALDRFAQFFIKPLMLQDAVLREIKAVDSEHKKNLLSDVCRWSQSMIAATPKTIGWRSKSRGCQGGWSRRWVIAWDIVVDVLEVSANVASRCTCRREQSSVPQCMHALVHVQATKLQAVKVPVLLHTTRRSPRLRSATSSWW